ncbi:MAG TPA: NAD(P)H-hydrate dehydratase [Verrucomicrobiae bacterium]|nr:NAD(P)H-hydrate dehydratase [Verrucomicrobiae bacterium]
MKAVTAAQMVKIEQEAINEYGIPGILLMENAALAVLDAATELLGDIKGKRVVIIAGKGNNGGDGLALGRHLVNRGAEVKVFLCGQVDDLKPDSHTNFKLLRGLGTAIFQVTGETELRAFKLALMTCDLAVDALYGTGFRGALPPVEESYVKALNESLKPVVAVDIPSGLEADSGKVYKEAVRARITVSFGLPKLGHFLGLGPEYSGQVRVDSISIPQSLLSDSRINTHVLTAEQVAKYIPPRTIEGHKGTHGMGLMIGGSPGMTGALALTARSALRSGAGLVQMAVGASQAATVDSLVLEAMTLALDELKPGILDPRALEQLRDSLARAKAISFGPGMGQTIEVAEFLYGLIERCPKPLVIDADGLNALALDLKMLARAQGPIILTPHPGEMARLTGLSIKDVLDNRLDLALEKAIEWKVILVLKGPSTIVVSPDGRAYVNPTGNPVLGTGGTGDVLTGVITGFLAQGAGPLEAACLGVYCHGLAGDILAEDTGNRGGLAQEVCDNIPKAIRRIQMA